MIAIVLAALCVQANPAAPQQAEAVVTIKRKAFTWSFIRLPERRADLGDPPRPVDLPSQIYATWTALDPQQVLTKNPFQGNTFLLEPGTLIVPFYQPGKVYLLEGEAGDSAALAADHRRSLSELIQALLERYFEFDLEFPGGTWDELGRLVKDRLAAAFAQQKPESLKACLPDKIEIDLSTRPEFPVRYPAIQAKAITLSQLRAFGVAPRVLARQETTPRVVREKNGDFSVVTEPEPVLAHWILTDDHQVTLEALEVVFFNLAERPGLPRAEDVVTLFELAWKARPNPVFARVKYHPETKTIMLQGTAEEIGAARRAFATLTGRPLAEPTVSANPFDGITETLQKIAELLEKQSEGKDK